ncbi:MAG TPA: branched-chain amino acid ABC transporter permease, partial [Thermoleophilaceae bacterium]|nr:branched-chain amino acid ABC transporter permease [Thermoleophilaceae bacterium]
MATTGQTGGDEARLERVKARSGGLGAIGRAWNELPPFLRTAIPALSLLAIAVCYPLYVDSLPTNVPFILNFPSVSTAVIVIVFVMMAVGLNIVVGYAGLLDLGYVAFYAVGAYTAGWFASGHFQQVNFHLGSAGISRETNGVHINIWLVLLLAGLLTAIAGIIIGLPTLRLRGDYLAIVTLGFGEIIPVFVRNGDNLGGFNLTAGTFGINPIDSPGFGEGLNGVWGGLPVNFQQSFERENLFFYAALVLLLITLFCSVRLRESRLGRAWIAIREDETAAAAMGVPLMRTKTWAYALGAFFGGIAGAYYASFKSGAFPSEFYFNISVFLLCMVVLGGMGSIWGVVTAGAILAWLNVEGLANIGTWLKRNTPLDFEVAKYQFGIYGIIIVLMMLFRPTG